MLVSHVLFVVLCLDGDVYRVCCSVQHERNLVVLSKLVSLSIVFDPNIMLPCYFKSI